MTKNAYSRWKPMTQETFGEIPKEPGVYLIRCRDHPTNRLLGSDQEGILDIGESNNLRKRTRFFFACASGKKKRGHSAGCRFFGRGLDRDFPLDQLEIKWKVTKSKAAARKLEGDLLSNYEKKFGELPPLNSQANRS